MHRGCAALALAAVVVLAGAGGCKRKVSYDTSTPDNTLGSLARAMERGDIPGRVDDLVSDDTERSRWKLRCQEKRCRKAKFRVVDRGQQGAHQAVLYVDFEILDQVGARTLGGKRTPIHFAREGGHWYITQLGDEVIIPPAKPVIPADAAVPVDAAAPADAATAAGAADAGP